MRTETPAETFGRQVAESRGRKPGSKGWSQERLSEELKTLGVSIHSTAITKLERADRKVSLDELFAISEALGVAPIHLLVPRENDAPVRVAPALEPKSAEFVREWFQGERPLWSRDTTNEDDAFYFKEQPDEDYVVQQNALYQRARIVEVMARTLAVAEVAADRRGEPIDSQMWSEFLDELDTLNRTAIRLSRQKEQG